jgi:hypothetical protein
MTGRSNRRDAWNMLCESAHEHGARVHHPRTDNIASWKTFDENSLGDLTMEFDFGPDVADSSPVSLHESQPLDGRDATQLTGSVTTSTSGHRQPGPLNSECSMTRPGRGGSRRNCGSAPTRRAIPVGGRTGFYQHITKPDGD